MSEPQKRQELKEIMGVLSRYSDDELSEIRCSILYTVSELGVDRMSRLCKEVMTFQSSIRQFLKTVI